MVKGDGCDNQRRILIGFYCRYGLYGNPFESELFDIEPIIPGKSSSVPVTYANLVAGPNIVFNTPPTSNEPAMNGFFSIIKQLNCKEFANKGRRSGSGCAQWCDGEKLPVFV